MRLRLNLRWLLVPAVLLSLEVCRAHDLTFNFGGTNGTPPLWDLSGFYSLGLTVEEPSGTAIPLTVGFNMVQDGAGRLHGFANDFQELDLDENSSFTVTYSITGKVTGSDGVATAHFVIHFVGHGSSSGQPDGPFSATLQVDAQIDTNTLALEAIKPARFMAKLPQTSLRGTIPDFSASLPPGQDGTWTLTMQFDTFNKVVGTAVISTPSQNLGMSLSGVFKQDSSGVLNEGIFDFKARGAGDVANTVSGVGSTATIQLTSPDFNNNLLNGKLMGQHLFFIFPP